MIVKQVMHKNVNWKSPDTKLSDIARVMKQEDIGAVPLGENDRLVGMITDRDIVVRGLADHSVLSDLKARDVMSKGIIFCMEDDTVEKAVELMSKKKVRRLPVLNEKKRLVGMLSLGDISSSASPALAGSLAHAVASHH